MSEGGRYIRHWSTIIDEIRPILRYIQAKHTCSSLATVRCSYYIEVSGRQNIYGCSDGGSIYYSHYYPPTATNKGVLEELFGNDSYTLANNNHPAWYETEEYARKLNKLRW